MRLVKARKPALLLACLLLAPHVQAEPQRAEDAAIDLEASGRLLEDGARAVVWYLAHSGWAVRTRHHLLIFDYWEMRDRAPGEGLTRGLIEPAEVAGLSVRVFVSHSHSDHFDRTILMWKEAIPDIRYIFGWKPEGLSPDVAFGGERESRRLDGMVIHNVHHEFDGIPESAFLVEVDGLVIYHAGDHGQPTGKEHPAYRSNLEYLASLGKSIDLAFIPDFAHWDDTLEALSPAVAVPMHAWGDRTRYDEIRGRSAASHPELRVFAAKKPGDALVY